jgi:hypothetical protein
MSRTDPPVEMVGLRSEIKIWCDRPFNEYPEVFLEAFDALVTPVKDQLKWYQNYTMNRFSPVTNAIWSSPRTWLTRGKQDTARSLYLKGPDEMMANGKYVIEF